MILMIKNGKIIGVEKELLNMLNATLENVSQIVSEIELILSSKENRPLYLQNYSFEVKKIPFFSLEDIEVYNLHKLVEEPSINLEHEIENIKIETPELPEIKLQEPTISTEEQSLDFTIKPQVYEEEIKPKIEEEKKEIVISFESSLDEINEILSLDKERANQLIAEELKKATEDLGIDYQTIIDLYNHLLKQFQEEKENFYSAIFKKDYEFLHKTAHKLKGAALNLRLSKLALILKNIDEEAKAQKPIEQIKFLIDKFYSFLDKIKNKNNIQIPNNLKELILTTIKEYLETQNEKKFKKDIKYIEKVLNTKINSLEELKKIIEE